jgi:hypothetical protein
MGAKFKIGLRPKNKRIKYSITANMQKSIFIGQGNNKKNYLRLVTE